MYMHESGSENKSRELVLKNITSCLVTKGFSRAVIIDSQRGDYRIVPNSLIEFITEMQFKTKDEIYSLAKTVEEKSIIEEYLDYVEEMEFSFWCPKQVVHNFSDILLDWDCPSIIQNAIVSVSSKTDIANIISQLAELGCFHIQLRLLSYYSLDDIDRLLYHFENSIFTSIEICLEYIELLELDDIKSLLNKHTRVHSIVFYNAKRENSLYSLNEYQRIIFYSAKIITHESADIGINQFEPNITFYTESILHNTYYNRKVCIDERGFIRNSPHLPWHYGNVSDTKISNAVINEGTESGFFVKYSPAKIDFEVAKPAFNSLWNVNKQLIDVCKDCEFRNMCLDARCPLQRKDGSWFYTKECNYNPYICKWLGEEGYRTLAECNIVVNETEFYVDEIKLEAINKRLWQD